MARAKRDPLESSTYRVKQPPQKQPDWSKLEEGRFIGYYRPISKAAGSWVAKWRDVETGARKQVTLGTADDLADEDENKVLTWAQANAKAREWFELASHEAILLAGGQLPHKGPYTVSQALSDYFRDAERRGVKGVARDRQRSAVWIERELGKLDVAKLNRERIEAWLEKMAEAPPRRREGKAGPKPPKKPKPGEQSESPKAPQLPTEDQKRARKDSANRVLTTLKAALNFALDRKKVKHGEAWESVAPYRETTKARIRFLTPEEQVRLVNACPPDFRRLVKGALYTGARYGELTRLQVGDFNAREGTVFIEFSKSGEERYIVLAKEAQDFFVSLTSGRPNDELMFLRDEVERRKLHDVGGAWGKSEQARFMALACKAADVAKASFHELRHTYASGLVNAGLPMAYVAAQLGHKNTRMTEKHYGHLDRAALTKAIRELAPKLGLGETPNVVPLKVTGA
jgi:integrase